MNNILQKYPNFRETFMAVLTAVILFFGESFGLEAVAQIVIAMITGSHIVGQGIANTNPWVRLQTASRKIGSKKFLFSLLFVVLTVLGDKMGMQDLTQTAIAIIAGFVNVGVGITDSKTKEVELKFEDNVNNLPPPPLPQVAPQPVPMSQITPAQAPQPQTQTVPVA